MLKLSALRTIIALRAPSNSERCTAGACPQQARGLIYGQRRQKHKRLSVLHLHRAHAVVGWEARHLRTGDSAAFRASRLTHMCLKTSCRRLARMWCSRLPGDVCPALVKDVQIRRPIAIVTDEFDFLLLSWDDCPNVHCYL